MSKREILKLFIFVFLMAGARLCPGQENDPPGQFPLELERDRTLIGPNEGQLVRLRRAQALWSAPLTFGTVRWAEGWQDTSGLHLGDTSAALVVSPRGGLELRQMEDGDRVKSFEAGGRVRGKKGALRFSSEVRMFAESHSVPTQASTDGEFVDRSKNGDLSNFTFTSYSRYRTTAELTTPVGEVGFRREALHWGPGQAGNLVLNRFAVPYPNFYWTGSFGTVSLEAVYGLLSHGRLGEYRTSEKAKGLYAHRYEWRPTEWLAIGASEILVVDGKQNPAAVIPFVPLFVEKGEGLESSNNGALSFDLAARRWGSLAWVEFMLDDLQEPTSLFDDYWGNRWAVNAGALKSGRLSEGRQWDLSVEWTRIEPWVYTHYRQNSAQLGNLESPLGNPDGPNSQSVRLDAGIEGGAWRFAGSLRALWKGSDVGSSILDTASGKSLTRMDRKTFLAGVDTPELEPGAFGWWRWKHVSLGASVTMRSQEPVWRVRLLSWL